MQEVNASQILGEEPQTEIEVSLAEFDKMVEQKKALDRLLKNEDFNTIIVDGYLEEDYRRLSDLLKNTSVNSKVVADRQIIVDKIVAKGYLDNWITTVMKTTEGIDNPEQRVALQQELNRAAEEQLAEAGE